MKKKLPRVLVILGPTATGKSDLAVGIARIYNGEIISADSRQVYTGLDIGSGKITKREMKGIPHHLLDIINPKKVYTVEEFKRDASDAIADIGSRGKLPIVCGGTGFYIDALIFDEQFPAVPPNKVLRAKLWKKTTESLYKELLKLDPRRAKNIDPHNKVRIIRAIEIARVLGRVPKLKRHKKYDAVFLGLTLPREKLRENIHKRLMKRMKNNALIREVRDLRKNGLSWKRLHSFGLEYRYVALYLQKKLTKKEMLAELEWQIADFSKRQMTWFNRNKNIRWFSPGQAKNLL